MKKNIHLLRLLTVSTVFALGMGVIIHHNVSKTPIKVEAAQHLTNYDLYTYSGSYYSDFDFNDETGLNGSLRQKLTTKIVPKDFYTYNKSGVNTLSTQLQYCDEDPTNSNNMVYLYTRNSVPKSAATVNSKTVWNREHVWCQSLSSKNWGTEEGGTDLLHLRPVYYSVNSSRGNTPYGDVGKTGPRYYDVDLGKVVNDNTKMLFGYSNGTYFEPIDGTKGDVAREIMYLWVAYNGYVTPAGKEYQPLQITNIIKDYNTLLTWHTQDKPDVLEGNRNDYVETSKQKNRNPFVDYPELAWKIFGNEVSEGVRNACMETYPAAGGGEPVAATGVRLNKTSATMTVDDTLQLIANLQPSGASGSITWSSSDESVATVDNGLVTALAAGSTTITARVSENISASCLITIEEPTTTTLFTADLTNTMSVTSGYTITKASAEKKTGYYQDKGTQDETLNSFTVKKDSALFSYVPSKIYFVANICGGTAKDPLDHNVEACLVDSSGNDITYTKVILTTKVTNSSATYKVLIPYSADAYGAKIMHLKADGHNIRYYSFSLIVDDAPSYPDEYLGSTDSLASMHGEETSNIEQMTSSLTFSSKFNNDRVLSSNTNIGQVTMVGDKGTHQNITPTYYVNGGAIRMYAGNTLTFTAARPISSITFTFTKGSNANLTSENASLILNSWSCSSNTVVFSSNTTDVNDNHIRVSAVSVTYEGQNITSIDDLTLGFGATIPKTDWDMISAKWTISDYGFKLVRESTLLDTYDESSVEEADNAEKDTRLVHKGSGEVPYSYGDKYLFTTYVQILDPLEYDIVFCVAPFMVIDGAYYFFKEMRYSVRDLAELCLNTNSSNLSTAALLYLIGD